MPKKTLCTILINCFARIQSLLPLPLVRVQSDLLAFISYYLIRYRRKVLRINLQNSFPNHSRREIKRLERRYYRHFVYQMLSTFKLLDFKAEDLSKHISFENVELLQRLRAEGHKAIILMMGHFGNWEYLSASQYILGPKGFRLYQIYRPLRSQAVDQLFRRIRERFGSYGIPKNDVGRALISLCRNNDTDETPLVVFIADQTPRGKNVHYWTKFLNQPTAFFTGAERLAKKLELPVVFADVIAVHRDHYKVRFELIREPSEAQQPYDVTEEYARLMERCILRKPALWLWTHKRWKEDPQNYFEVGYSDELRSEGYPKQKKD